MAIWSNPQQADLQVDREDIDDFYTFLNGPEIGRRAERAAWRKITTLGHGGSTLKNALLAIQREALFWTREVYEKIAKDEPQRQSPQSGNEWSWKALEAAVAGKYKTYPKWRGKGKQSAPWLEPPRSARVTNFPPLPPPVRVGPHPIDPTKWCDKDSNRKNYCRNYQHGRCRGGCRRSHRCPIRLPSGEPCDGDHHSTRCPSLDA